MTVYLVGAGPGSADLLTLRAARLLLDAEIVVHDRLVDPSVLALVARDAEVIDVGKRPGGSHSQELINDLLVNLGRRSTRVVRLKGGDPFLFGRGGEEAMALRAAGNDYEVVPGVTSALSAPTAAGIPVTHRGLSRGVTIVTGHAQGSSRVDLSRLAVPGITLVILMGVSERADISRQLIDGGLSCDTPVAVIESAWTPRQRVLRATLSRLEDIECVAPAIIVVGEVAALELVDLVSLVPLAN